MIVNSIQILRNAKKNNYAIGAFNFTTLEQLKAIIKASEETNMPVILATSESAIKFMGLENIVDLVTNEVYDSDIPYVLHLDHGKNFEICKVCIDAGFSSVMIDASALPFEENIALTKKVVDYAHVFNVSVEGELGKLQGVEDEVRSKDSVYTNADDAVEFIKQTNVDSLAISIGTSHGAYKFKGESKLNIELLKIIDEKTNHFPLVLHGASSLSDNLLQKFKNSGGEIKNAKGVSSSNLTDAIQNGICKINVDTDLRLAFTTGVRNSLNNTSVFNLREYLENGMKETILEVKEHINLFLNKKD